MSSAFDYGSMGYNPGYAGGAQFPPLTPPPPVTSNTGGGGGGFFGNFKFSDLMPVAAAGLGGIFSGRTADNYGRSMLAAQQLTADAALGTAMINANLGKDMARFGLNLDQQAAQRNLQFQRSAPFQDLLVTRANMGDSGIGFEQRAAARKRMFGGLA